MNHLSHTEAVVIILSVIWIASAIVGWRSKDSDAIIGASILTFLIGFGCMIVMLP